MIRNTIFYGPEDAQESTKEQIGEYSEVQKGTVRCSCILLLPLLDMVMRLFADSFKYDPFGSRIYKSSSSGTSAFACDGDNLVEVILTRYEDTVSDDESP